jgi:ATP-binding cassette, subfamily C (CFTR/MRP), member 4
LAGIIVVVAIVNVWLLLPTAVIAILFYFLRVIYLATSRSVKRLEGVTRSPVFSHLNASIQGVTTIRAFGSQDMLSDQFDHHQDLHSSAWYLFISTSRSFGYWLDVICFIYIAIVTLSFLFMEESMETSGGNVGLAITQALGLTGMFQWGMRQSAEMENQMTSVERVIEFSNLEAEPPLETDKKDDPGKGWPSKGFVTFDGLVMRYSKNDPPVLKGISFNINSGEKIGVVGRTGAGKSSLISALFRLADCYGGRIVIDDVNTSTLGLHQLRANISIIPQEPVLFSGTMRKNLDPFDEFPDDLLWSALEEVELKEAVADLPGGLGAKMSEGGSNFSVGQRQLVNKCFIYFFLILYPKINFYSSLLNLKISSHSNSCASASVQKMF